jgi:hypothetical protein
MPTKVFVTRSPTGCLGSPAVRLGQGLVALVHQLKKPNRGSREVIEGSHMPGADEIWWEHGLQMGRDVLVEPEVRLRASLSTRQPDLLAVVSTDSGENLRREDLMEIGCEHL